MVWTGYPPGNQNRTKAFAIFPWTSHINIAGVGGKLHFRFRFRNFGAPSPVLVALIATPKPQVIGRMEVRSSKGRSKVFAQREESGVRTKE